MDQVKRKTPPFRKRKKLKGLKKKEIMLLWWDVLHNGRLWAEKCKGKHNNFEVILRNINSHF